MKISKDKQIAFLKRIIDDTKSGEVYWDQLSKNSVAASEAFPNEVLDPEGVFQCGFRVDLDGHFLIAMSSSGHVKGSIGVNYNQMIQFSYEYEEIDVLLTRLFNLIFEKRPNVNRFIDQYLSLNQNEDNGQ